MILQLLLPQSLLHVGLSINYIYLFLYLADAPSSPGKPQIPTYDRTTADLEWDKPASDGGDKITGYIVEKRESRSQRWSKATREPVTTCSFQVTGLIEGREYLFRVLAENKAGPGTPSPESDHHVAKAQFGE